MFRPISGLISKTSKAKRTNITSIQNMHLFFVFKIQNILILYTKHIHYSKHASLPIYQLMNTSLPITFITHKSLPIIQSILAKISKSKLKNLYQIKLKLLIHLCLACNVLYVGRLLNLRLFFVYHIFEYS